MFFPIPQANNNAGANDQFFSMMCPKILCRILAYPITKPFAKAVQKRIEKPCVQCGTGEYTYAK